jgi:hypothetical protein
MAYVVAHVERKGVIVTLGADIALRLLGRSGRGRSG